MPDEDTKKVGLTLIRVPLLIVLSLAYVAGLVLFALATLPVEIGASRRALTLLEGAHLADDGHDRVLSASRLVEMADQLQAAARAERAGHLW